MTGAVNSPSASLFVFVRALAVAALSVSALALGGCSASDEALYPSLAPRPIEKAVAAEMAQPAPRPAAATPLDPALAARLKDVRATAEAAGKALDQAIAESAPAAPAAEPGSESWVDNQAALSRLGSAQAALRSAGTDLGAVQSGLASAKVQGAATGALEDEATALEQQIDAAIAKSQSAIGSRR